MRDGYEAVVGIRLRSSNGDKWAVTGSHQGCFIPDNGITSEMVLVVEGPTDCAAALDLGFPNCIGRPSCSGGLGDIKTLIKRHRIRRVAIICDNDEPGVRGGRTLVEVLPVPCVQLVLPCKDVRAFLACGGTKQMIESRINAAIWQNVW